MMGGRIWVESEPGGGSTFHFTAAFDLVEGTAAARRRKPLRDAPSTPARRWIKVLRRRRQRWSISASSCGLLTKRGHTVTVVSDGREAVDALEREAFDLVLMDVQMPVMGGFEATAAIRARERGPAATSGSSR